MSSTGNLELMFALAGGIFFGFWFGGMALRRELHYLVLEILAQPKVTQALQIASRLSSSSGKTEKGLVGLATRFLGPMLSQWAQAAQGPQEGAPVPFFRPPPPQP